jgi:predicted metal-dependent phosphoesterase TrpH
MPAEAGAPLGLFALDGLRARAIIIGFSSMTMRKDFHMHTCLSDGTPTPEELVRACLELQLDEISITDHDSIGAYPAVFDIARGKKMKIVPGAELDCAYGDIELHMLGFGLDIENEALRVHLAQIQAARKRRAAEQADAINRHHGRKVIDLEAICARCETFMNPHLIHEMIDQKLFDAYEPPDRYKQAQSWMKKNIRVESVIQKPTAQEIIHMIHNADGTAVLAHPGYYVKDGYDLPKMVADLKEMGMDGIEVVYPYCQEGSREFPTIEDEKEAVQMMADLAERFELVESTGSDAHQIEQLRAFHSRS